MDTRPPEPDYLHDESRLTGQADAILFANSETEIATFLAQASADHKKVTIQGARTGITGGAVPQGGLILNLSRLDKITFGNDNTVTVEPGVLLQNLLATTSKNHLFLPTDPTEKTATLGGMLACNASGACSYSYGPIRPWVNSLRLVLANGATLALTRGQNRATNLLFQLHTENNQTFSGSLPNYQQPPIKSAAGYYSRPNMDLLDLFIGAEGTLGVITQATLRLLPHPPHIWNLIAFFPTENMAIAFVQAMRGTKDHAPVAIEYLDAASLNFASQSPQANLWPAIPQNHCAVYLEYHSNNESLLEQAVEQLATLILKLGGQEDAVWLATSPHESEKIHLLRHAVPEEINRLIAQRQRLCPELTKLGTDMAVPPNQLTAALHLYRTTLAAAGLEYAIFGHIGDSHLHVNILPRNMAEYAQGRQIYLDWAKKIVALGGTVSAEHGIGKLKRQFLAIMWGEAGIEEMRRLKKILDPAGILNCGNLFA